MLTKKKNRLPPEPGPSSDPATAELNDLLSGQPRKKRRPPQTIPPPAPQRRRSPLQTPKDDLLEDLQP
jgi:hypothetical protein